MLFGCCSAIVLVLPCLFLLSVYEDICLEASRNHLKHHQMCEGHHPGLVRLDSPGLGSSLGHVKLILVPLTAETLETQMMWCLNRR